MGFFYIAVGLLREFPAGDDAVRLEVRVLSAVAGLSDLAPRLVAADAEGEVSGCPLIVTTLLPGRASIIPDRPREFARQLGDALARIHSLAVDTELPELFAEPPADSPTHSIWRQLRDEPRVLSHNDFWSGNTVWLQGRLTGIVDWSGAGLAPRGYDLAWCRQDLVFLYNETIADVFTGAYDAAFGSPTLDVALWDCFAALKAYPRVETWAPNYEDLGRTDLDDVELRRRLTEWMATLAG